MSRWIAICDGSITVDGSGLLHCSGTWINIDASSIPGAFDVNLLSPVTALSYFGAGFGVVASVAVTAIGAGILLSFLRGS